MGLAQLDATTINTPGITFSVIYRQSVASTNSLAYELALQGAPEGTLLVADAQYSGRGRLGRTWFSPAGKNLYASLILRPTLVPRYASQLPLVAGLAVHEALAEYIPHVALKWPNDVLVADKKICGILAELKSSTDKIDFVIVGFGVNINQQAEEFDESICRLATSLLIETGKPQPRAAVLKKVLARLGELYYRHCHEGFVPLKEEWLKASEMLGRRVVVDFKGAPLVAGRVVNINHYGSLVCQKDDGAIVEISAGDATLVKE